MPNVPGSAARDARVDHLDGWRGLSIAGVLQGHFFLWPGFDGGSLGVSMFFALSGLLMSGILFELRQPLPLFYRRRFARILPAFTVFVLAVFAVAALRGAPFTAAEFGSTLLFLRTYFPASGIWGTGMPIGHLWSLNVEEHCYLLMSLLVLVPALRHREGPVLTGCGLACIATGFLYVRLGAAAPRWGLLGTEVAGATLLLSAGYRLIRERLGLRVGAVLPVAAFTAAVAVSQAGPWWSRMALLPPLLAFTVNHLAEIAPRLRRALAAAPLRRLGLWSFSLYLWQQPFYQYQRVFPGGAAGALGAAIVVALLSFYMVEQPARRWLNRRAPHAAADRPPDG